MWFLLLSFFLAYSQRSQIGVYHTSTHDVALVRIQNAEFLVRFAENTSRKNSPSAHHSTTLSGYVFASKAYQQSEKNNRKKIC